MIEKFPNLYKISSLNIESLKSLIFVWLVDFGQGNFTEAKTATDLALLADWNGLNLLARGIVHQLQGEYVKALSLLESAFETELSPEHKLITAMMGQIVDCRSNAMLADNCLVIPPQKVSNGLWQERVKLLRDNISDLDLGLGIDFLDYVSLAIPSWRSGTLSLTRWDIRESYIEKITDDLTLELELYQGREQYALAEFIYGCFAEFLALGGQFRAGWELLEHLIPSYKNAEKHLQTAWYYLCQGDLVVEMPPFGKAIVFGYCLTNPRSGNVDSSKIDRLTAQQLYNRSRQYFALAGASRGEGMAMMRLAYLNGVGSQWNLASYGYEEAKNHFAKTGDKINTIAAQMGQWWSSLQYEELRSETIEQVQDLTKEIFDRGSFSWGISFGLAFVYAAKDALILEKEYDVCFRLITIAEIILMGCIDRDILWESQEWFKLWKDCLILSQKIYRDLALFTGINNDWGKSFLLAEKSRIYNLYLSGDLKRQAYRFKRELNLILDIEQLKEYLERDTLVISYLISDGHLLIWGISSKGLIGNCLIDRIQDDRFSSQLLEELIEQWTNNLPDREYFIDRNLESVESRKLVLETILFEFISSFLDSIDNLVIVADGCLKTLPFSALKSFESGINYNQKDLGLDKKISYIPFAHSLSKFSAIKIDAEQISVVIENTLKKQVDAGKYIPGFFLCKGVSFTLGTIYGINPMKVIKPTPKYFNNQSIIHLVLSESSSFLDDIDKDTIMGDLLILRIPKSLKDKSVIKKIITQIEILLQGSIKTVVVIFNSYNNIATAMLTYFFHQSLYFGQSVGSALKQAQTQLKNITTQEALDFCYYLKDNMDLSDRDYEAIDVLINKQIGDILVLGEDYSRATTIYESTIYQLNNLGYNTIADSLQGHCNLFSSLTDIPTTFQQDKLIFDSPIYWGSAFILGNSQLSFTILDTLNN